jgi:hypothetical protein
MAGRARFTQPVAATAAIATASIAAPKLSRIFIDTNDGSSWGQALGGPVLEARPH